MVVLKAIRNIALFGGLFYGTCFGLNYSLNHNDVFETEGFRDVRKVDGMLARTTFSQVKGKLYDAQIVRESRLLWPSATYTDYGLDGIVDEINTSSLFFEGKSLWRENDYLSHQEEFDRADKIFAEQKERFKDYL